MECNCQVLSPPYVPRLAPFLPRWDVSRLVHLSSIALTGTQDHVTSASEGHMLLTGARSLLWALELLADVSAIGLVDWFDDSAVSVFQF